MRTQIARNMKYSGGGLFSCTWTTSRSLLEELIGAYSRSSSPLPPPPPPPPSDSLASPPLIMLPKMHVGNDGSMLYSFFNPVNRKFSFVEKHESLPDTARPMTSSKGWVTLGNSHDGAFYIWNPSSDVQKDVLNLPSARTLPCVMCVEFAQQNDSPTTTNITSFTFNDGTSTFPSELARRETMIISGSFSGSPDEGNRCIAMGYHGRPTSLHYSEIGGTAWKSLDSPLGQYAQVIASSKKDKLFFALSSPGEIEAWDLSDLSDIKRTLVIEAHRLLSHSDRFCTGTDLNGETYYKREIDYIVESFGDLLLVTRHIACYSDARYDSNGYYRTVGFAVRRLNFGLKRWETINCLNGCAIFLGLSGECFSLPACHYSGLKKNAIYFAPADQFSEYGGHDSGVFYMGDDKIDRYSQLALYHQTPSGCYPGTLPPFWVAPPHSPSPN